MKDEERWITINGSHVLINQDGKVLKGNKKVKEIVNSKVSRGNTKKSTKKESDLDRYLKIPEKERAEAYKKGGDWKKFTKEYYEKNKDKTDKTDKTSKIKLLESQTIGGVIKKDSYSDGTTVYTNDKGKRSINKNGIRRIYNNKNELQSVSDFNKKYKKAKTDEELLDKNKRSILTTEKMHPDYKTSWHNILGREKNNEYEILKAQRNGKKTHDYYDVLTPKEEKEYQKIKQRVLKAKETQMSGQKRTNYKSGERVQVADLITGEYGGEWTVTGKLEKERNEQLNKWHEKGSSWKPIRYHLVDKDGNKLLANDERMRRITNGTKTVNDIKQTESYKNYNKKVSTAKKLSKTEQLIENTKKELNQMTAVRRSDTDRYYAEHFGIKSKSNVEGYKHPEDIERRKRIVLNKLNKK